MGTDRSSAKDVARMMSSQPGGTELELPVGWSVREAAQATAYDLISDRYGEAFPHKEGQLACADWVLARLRAGASVLDLGCGTGLPSARQLADGGCRVTGIDISPAMLAQARSNVPQATFLELDMTELGSLPGGYAAVVAFFSLLNLPRSLFPRVLGLIREALVPGGLFSLAMVEADIDDMPITFLGSRIFVTGYMRDELRSALQDAGFRVAEERAISYAPASTEAGPEIQLFVNCSRPE
jgi:cyclopropane fatty-acyl-phospholipid synthase-like methyltransferase